MSLIRASCSCLRTPLTRTAPTPLLARSIHAPASQPLKAPATRGPYTSPESLLKAAGRKLEAYAPKLGDSWEELFTKTSADMAQAGMTVKERRYALWVLEKFRRGHDPSQIAIPATPKKKIRGWGPKVQMGKRVR